MGNVYQQAFTKWKLTALIHSLLFKRKVELATTKLSVILQRSRDLHKQRAFTELRGIFKTGRAEEDKKHLNLAQQEGAILLIELLLKKKDEMLTKSALVSLQLSAFKRHSHRTYAVNSLIIHGARSLREVFSRWSVQCRIAELNERRGAITKLFGAVQTPLRDFYSALSSTRERMLQTSALKYV